MAPRKPSSSDTDERGSSSAMKVLLTIGSDTPEILAELNAVEKGDRAGRIRILATLGALHLQGKLVTAIGPSPTPNAPAAVGPPPETAKDQARASLAAKLIGSVQPERGPATS